MKEKTNLRVLKKTRKAPETGDIFTFQLNQFTDRYFFGRVMKIDTKIGNIENVILVYVYKNTSPEKFKIPELRIEDLMIPPKGINALPWTKGYFETICSKPIEDVDILQRHCFKFLDPMSGLKYFDEYGNKLTGPSNPCGDWGMGGYISIDRAASRYMGIQFLD